MEIGERLKEAREAKQLSLDQIQEMTKIQKRYLLAIEEGNFKVLPGKFYARAFIKEYAIAVDLNADELLEEHKESIPMPEKEEQAVQYSRIQRTRKESHQTKTSSFSFFPTLIVVLLVIGIIFVAITLYQKATSNSGESNDQADSDEIIRDNHDENDIPVPDLDEDDENVEDDQELEVDEEIEEPSSELELTVAEQTRGETTFDLNNVGDQLQLTLSSSGRTWIGVENGDGTSLYSGELTADASPYEIDISAEEQIYIKTGFAPDLQVLVNETELEITNEPNVQSIWININRE